MQWWGGRAEEGKGGRGSESRERLLGEKCKGEEGEIDKQLSQVQGLAAHEWLALLISRAHSTACCMCGRSRGQAAWQVGPAHS